jgi:energy-coupling factor transport system ATP-binding protein
MLAVMLMRQPLHGILLDEPSLGQDKAHKAMLIRLAKSLNQAGKMMILTTHDLTLAAQTDRIILLGDEGILSQGACKEVLNDHQAWKQAGLFIPAWISPAKGQQSC